MPAHRTSAWTAAEVAVLREHYPNGGGVAAVQPLLGGRSWHAIHVKAHKLGLRSGTCGPANKARLAGADLDEAMRLREVEGWSFARIGERFGLSEGAATNAVTMALCLRRGFTPAQRDATGHLTPEGVERIRYALRKGLKGIDIQLRLGVSASTVSHERRRYEADLKSRGKAPLPPPGGGVRYSGVKVGRADRLAAEALFLQGLGTQKVHERTGLSSTSCTRIRNRLIRRLKRRGETLPGCDATGARRVQAESTRFITDAQRQAVRAMLLDRVPARRAGMLAAVGTCSAYRIRDELAAELAARGEEMAAPVLPGRGQAGRLTDPNWPPRGTAEIYAFRQLLATMPFDDAKARWRADRRAEAQFEAQRPRTFEEQLARVAAGEVRLVTVQPRAHLEARGTVAQRAA